MKRAFLTVRLRFLAWQVNRLYRRETLKRYR